MTMYSEPSLAIRALLEQELLGEGVMAVEDRRLQAR